jgi:hypothetical protein
MRKYTYILTHFILFFLFSSIIDAQSTQSLIPAIVMETFGDVDWDTEASLTNPAPPQSVGYEWHWDFDDINTFTVTNGHWIGGSDSSIRINSYIDNHSDEVTACSEGMHLHITLPGQYSGSWDTVILADIQISGYYDFVLEFGYVKRPWDNYSVHRGLTIDVRVDDGSWVTLDTTYIPYGIEEGAWYCISIPMTGIPTGNEMDIRFSTVHNHIGLDNVALRGLYDNYWGDATGRVHFDIQNLNSGIISNASDCSGDLYLAWDNWYLYGMVDVKDDMVSSNSETWWQNDGLDLKFDLVPKLRLGELAGEPWDTYDMTETCFSTETGIDAERNGTGNTIIRRGYSENGYTIEFAIPFNEIVNMYPDPDEYFDPVLGNQVGFMFEINDQDGDIIRDVNLTWGHKPMNGNFWRDVNQCGNITLIKNNQVRFSENNITEEDAVLYKFPVNSSPVIDGVVDGVWEDMDGHYNDVCFPGSPTTDELSQWKAGWDDEALYILLLIEDDEFCDQWCTKYENWLSDRVEVFIDVHTDTLKDGRGAIPDPGNGFYFGHYQYVTPWLEGQQSAIMNGHTEWPEFKPYDCGYARSSDSWVYELKIPFSSLTIDSIPGAIGELSPINDMVIGFDISDVDVDISEGLQGGLPIRKFNKWKVCDSWGNMDEAGELRFKSEETAYPHATLYKFPEGCAPYIDGNLDPVWNDVEEHDISRFFFEEVPTLNSATWRAAWTDDYIFVLVSVEDDDFYPDYATGSDAEWLFDRPEVYIDVNANLSDNGGVVNSAGHYEAAYYFIQGSDQYATNGMLGREGGLMSGDVLWAYNVNDPDYFCEFAISINSLIDNTGSALDPYTVDVIGFDVTVIDRDEGDEGRRRAVWKNTGSKNESYYNMDYCGDVALSSSTIATSVQPVSASITCDTNVVCPGTSIQLTAIPLSGTSAVSFTYSWTSDPAGFTSTLSNPSTTLNVTTIYTVEINDGINKATASKTIYTDAAPDKPEIILKGEDILICPDSGLYSYEWFYENVVLTGETKQFCRINPSLGGNYYVRTSIENGCKSTSDAFAFAASANIPEQDGIYIEVYPVPNSGNFMLNMLSDNTGEVTINIKDFSGNIIKNIVTRKNSGNLFEQINIGNVTKGLYLVEIMFNGKTYFKKMVIE